MLARESEYCAVTDTFRQECILVFRRSGNRSAVNFCARGNHSPDSSALTDLIDDRVEQPFSSSLNIYLTQQDYLFFYSAQTAGAK